uniref:Uncharacterized protein n=1 Tax=Euplotes crassus TaxID=5936 RepID=A0A7S3NQA5_EUPCR|mmetsp:Transcript_209/g.196  ORF Transcript_209/g.196 Transcript_209/m.196 type:complete len:108 (+) Transcript_209:21-344(+)
MSVNIRVVDPAPKVKSLVVKMKTTTQDGKSISKIPVMMPALKRRKSQLSKEEKKTSKMAEKSNPRTPMVKKKPVLGSKQNSVVSSPKGEEMEIKAKPFKKKMGFYVK